MKSLRDVITETKKRVKNDKFWREHPDRQKAIALFKNKKHIEKEISKDLQKRYDKLHESLPPNATAKDYIDDFVHSKNKKFSGDSKKERIKRALGAFYKK